MKRPFERDGDTLVDRYVVGGSRKETSTHIPRELFGPTPIRARMPNAPTRARLQGWIKRLLAGEWSALSAVVERRDFPGVRESLVAACSETLTDREIVTTALGQVGGTGAREVLARELMAAVRRREAFRSAEHGNRAAMRLTTLARDLLRMDPGDVAAAQALVRLFRHPVMYIRRYAAWHAAELDAQWNAPRTAAHAVLRLGLAPLLRCRDADVFAKAIPALWGIDQQATRARVSRLLVHRDPWVRHETAQGALKAPRHGGLELVAMVVTWLDTERSLRLVAEFANALAQVVAPDRLRDVAARALADESPSLRYDGVTLLRHLVPEVSRGLALVALRDEPDPALRRLLRGSFNARPGATQSEAM